MDSIGGILPILFVIAAILTRKDLAVVAAALSVIGELAWQAGYQYFLTVLIFTCLNAMLAIYAGVHNKLSRCNLSLIVMWLAVVQSGVNIAQYASNSYILADITGIIEFSILFAIFLMDGRKGLINGMVEDFMRTFERVFLRDRHSDNSKGHL